MLLLFLLITIPAVYTEECLHRFDKNPYSREAILTLKGLPTNLVIDIHTNSILFTLIDIESLQDDEVQTRMDQYIIRNGMPIKIDNVNGQSAAVDNKNKKIYIASDDGLNVLNNTNRANFIAFKGEDITHIFKPADNDKLYAVTYPDSEVFEIDLKKNEKRKIEEVPCAFMIAVDTQENIYYECDSKYVKVLLKDFKEPIEFVGIPKNSARAIAVDDKNRVILAANDGLYWLKPDSLIPEKLMNLDFVPSGIAFSGSNVYLATNGIIYEYSNKSCS